jgi:hypothetical protein
MIPQPPLITMTPTTLKRVGIRTKRAEEDLIPGKSKKFSINTT